MNKPKILIAVPTMGSMNTMLVVNILQWIAQAANEKKYNLDFYPTLNVVPVDRAREQIVDAFLKSDCTHIFWIDADTIPKKDALQRLLDHNVDFVSGITPIIEHDPLREGSDSNGFYKKWNCVGMDEKHVKPNTGVFPIKGAGGSCLLVKRKVYETLQKPYYEFRYKDDSGKDTSVSEDILFTIKCIAAGFTPLCDTSVIAAHYKPIYWDFKG